MLTTDRVTQILNNSNVFGLLSNTDKATILPQFEVLGFEPGETIVEQGTNARGIYLIAKGRAHVLQTTSTDSGSVHLQTLGPEDSFGEQSLIAGTVTSASIQAAEHVTVLRLPAVDVEHLLSRSPHLLALIEERISHNSEFNFLRTMDLLSDLTRVEVQSVLQSIETLTLDAGECLFHEGDSGDAAYIIRSGQISIVKESADHAELAVRGSGELIGEMSLHNSQARSAAAFAVSNNTTLLRLRQQDYNRVLAKSTVRDAVERVADARQEAQQSALYAADTEEGRTTVLKLLSSEGGVNQFWQSAKKEKRTPEEALQSLSRATGLDYVTPNSQLLVDPEVVQQISGQYAQANQILPVFSDNYGVEVLTTTPFLGTIPRELSVMLKRPVTLRLSEPAFLEKLIDTTTVEGEGIAGTLSDLAGGDNWDELDSIEDLKDQAQAAPIIKLVNNVFMDAISRKASDIHIDPYEEELEVRYRIDGILQLFSNAPRRYQAAIISRIKIMANLDISERRIPQDGRISLRLESKNFDIRVATIPTVFGEGVVMRILDKSSVQVQLDDIGFAPAMLERWQWAITQPNGVVLVTGPTGSGKTTTLYATLNRVKNAQTKIITAEDPVEYQLHGIKQVQIDGKVNLTFAAALRSMLRLDPDIIMVGEVRDFETAEIAIQAALTGHLVFSTLHTNDAPTAVTRLVEMGIAPYLVASAVTAVLAQRLVRKLCTNCRSRNADGQWQSEGCSQCDNTGYKGRLGIYELMIINDSIRELIIANKDSTVIAAEAQRQGLITLSEDGQQKVLQGLTSAEEIKRVAG